MTNIQKKDCPECKNLPEGQVVAGHDHRNVISKTYTEMAEEFIKDQTWRDDIHWSESDENGLKAFAKWLDSMPYLFPHMELLAMRKAREIDREVYFAMVDALGIEKSTEIAREIHKRHKHQK